MDVKVLKLGMTYRGKYGPDRTITRLSKTHLYYTQGDQENKTQNEKFAKWAVLEKGVTGESHTQDQLSDHQSGPGAVPATHSA